MKQAGMKAAVLAAMLAAGGFQVNGIQAGGLQTGVLCALAAPSDSGPGVVGTWKQTEDGRWWYRNPDGTYPQQSWKEIKSKWYYFDGEGYMQTGWLTVDGATYYLQADGSMVSGTAMTIDGVEYQFEANGTTQMPVKQPTVDLSTQQTATNQTTQTEQTTSTTDRTQMQKDVYAMADQVLARITTENMTKRQKAEAIYDWVRANMSYVNHSDKGDWVKAAYDGLRKKKGDCYTYYSVSLALLTRAGIQSIEVIRTDGHHWWNLINCGDGWYHFDTTPRKKNNRKFFMWTDAQLDAYNQISGGTHKRNTSLYPATPES